MVDKIESAILRNQYALAVFLDIQGAFDNIKPSSIIDALLKRKVSESIVYWYKHYLENRQIMIEVKGVKVKRHLVLGVPQGGVLSPIAWNIVFDDLLSSISKPTSIIGFADDGVAEYFWA